MDARKVLEDPVGRVVLDGLALWVGEGGLMSSAPPPPAASLTLTPTSKAEPRERLATEPESGQITGVNLTFTVDGAVEPASVAGYIVGLGSFKVELWGVTADGRNIYAIRNVPEGEHDVIVVGASEGNKTVDRGIRVSDVTFDSAKPLND